MSDYTKYTKQEMQAYAIAKSIKENQIVIVGTGLPLIGASLAKRAICPSCHPIVESGLMDCDPVEVPRSVGDNRFMAHCAVQWPNIRFVGFEANEWLHDEDRLVAFIGGAQIDPYHLHFRQGRLSPAHHALHRLRRRERHRHLLQHHHHDAAPEAPLHRPRRLHHLLRLDGRPRRP